MELVQAYQRRVKFDRLHYITMESVLYRISEKYKGKPLKEELVHQMVSELRNEMIHRYLDKFFQVEINFKNFKANVHEINPFHVPKECVTWNW